MATLDAEDKAWILSTMKSLLRDTSGGNIQLDDISELKRRQKIKCTEIQKQRRSSK